MAGALPQVSGKSLGNSASSVSTGKRSVTAPFGVSELSRPTEVSSLRTRRAVRSGKPVMRPTSPRWNSPRISASSNRRAASGLSLSLRSTKRRSRCVRASSSKRLFMKSLFELDALTQRLRRFVERSDRLRPEAARLLEEALIRGEFQRGEVGRITGLPERTARRVLNELTSAGLLSSDTPKGAVTLRFPVETLDALFPRLFPET